MDSMGVIIKRHNNKILRGTPNEETPGCKCQDKTKCPLEQKCETKGLIYQATITSRTSTKTYIGLTENSFKQRYTQHMSDFRLPSKRHKTRLSSYVWDLKDAGEESEITWKILKRAKPYAPGSKTCNLCSWEKVFISKAVKDKNNLNERTEFVNCCRHRKKFLLSKFEKG